MLTALKDAPRSGFTKRSTAAEVTAGIDLSGKLAVVTGATAGIGRETARVLAERGAHVIALGRTKDKAAAATAGFRGHITPMACELTDLASVAACADQIKALGKPVDLLINNAGIMALPKLEQVNGVEKQLFVNHFSHFVLTHRLLDAIKAAPQGRVVNLSSGGYALAPKGGIEFDNLSGERDYTGWKMYGQSKMANILFTRELARRFEGAAATANAVHPGAVKTELSRHMPGVARFFIGLIGSWVLKSPAQGAATSCHVAASPALAKVNGLYFADSNPEHVKRPEMEDAALAAKLWAVTEERTKAYLH
jgi:NAD(P)-dependent dehydrogenase (short-subunit alcohol dehydrogenase family)